MPVPQTSNSENIELNTEANYLDFENLRLLAIDLVQKYSGNIWTDYNSHDPGITILEALCFALTDLSFRTDFPIQDILSDKNGKLDYHNQSFFTVDEILNTSPINLIDLKKIILDKVNDVQNIEFKSRYENSIFTLKRGVYDVYVQLKPNVIDSLNLSTDNITKESFINNIKNQINETFLNNRYIGIDIQDIHILNPKELNISANISISKDVDAEEVLATMFFVINNYFTPFVKFDSPITLYNQSINIEEIFDGPSLSKGVIRKNSFQETIREVNESDIITLIRSIPGVKEVIRLSFSGISKNRSSFSISIKPDEYFTINHLSVKNDIKITTDEQVVKINNNFFDNLYKEKMYPNKLPNENEISEITNKNITGSYRHTNIYHTIQNYFPIIYGLGLEGVSSSEGNDRVAYLKQLKAFLSVFEQIMANYLSQLNSLGSLFSNKVIGENTKTYFSQSIHKITGLEDIFIFFNSIDKSVKNSLDESKPLQKLLQSLDKIAESDFKFNERKNAFLDHLLARFNISLNDIPILLYEQYYRSRSISKITNTLSWKSNVLQNISNITKNRLRAPIYDSVNGDNNYNYLSIIYTILYIQNKPFTSLLNRFKNDSESLDITYSSETEIITNQKLVLLDEVIPVIDNGQLLNISKDNDENEIVFEFQDKSIFIDACTNNNFKVLPDVFGGNSTSVLYKSRNNENWRIIAKLADKEQAILKINSILHYFIELNKDSEGIHMLESILLRPNENDSNFGFQIVDNTSKKVILKSSEFKNKKETELYYLELENQLLGLKISNFKEVASFISSKFIFYNINSTDNNLSNTLNNLQSLIKSESSNLSIEYIIKCQNGDEINADFYDYNINFIIPNWPARFQDTQFLGILKETIGEHLPAHIVPKFVLLDLEEMDKFENLYFNWSKHLSDKNSEEFYNLSSSLTTFLYNL